MIKAFFFFPSPFVEDSMDEIYLIFLYVPASTLLSLNFQLSYVECVNFNGIASQKGKIGAGGQVSNVKLKS